MHHADEMRDETNLVRWRHWGEGQVSSGGHGAVQTKQTRLRAEGAGGFSVYLHFIIIVGEIEEKYFIFFTFYWMKLSFGNTSLSLIQNVKLMRNHPCRLLSRFIGFRISLFCFVVSSSDSQHFLRTLTPAPSPETRYRVMSPAWQRLISSHARLRLRAEWSRLAVRESRDCDPVLLFVFVYWIGDVK